MKKILFLDIDGVLVSRRSGVAFNGFPNPRKHQDKFDFVAIGLIRKICQQGVDIVLSSSWRKGKGDEYKDLLGLPIIDRTPVVNGVRGDEIAEWINKNREPDKWAIVDDSSDMRQDQIPHFVHVDGNNGLLLHDYKRLCAILDIHEE